MRRSFVALATLVVMATTPSSIADVKPGGFMSANVTWLGNVPLDSPGVGARVVHVGGTPRLYVTGVKNLTIYDLSIPEIPVPLGTTPLPNWENEDVDVSADGSVVLVANDVIGTSYLIDASDPRLPRIAGNIPGTEHTLSCADAACTYAYGSSGRTYDLRDRAVPRRLVTGWRAALGVTLDSSVHDLTRDASGLVSVDTTPRLLIDPRANPASPTLITTGPVPTDRRLAYQHNSLRPNAAAWTPRGPGDTGIALRPGELLLANGETNFTTTCGAGSGPFATWSVRDFDKGAPMQVLDVYRPVSGSWTDGNPRVNAGLGCSGHWFTERGGIVAAGWYEHGTRFLRIDQATGDITEVGFFQPVVGSASAAYWVTDEIAYVVDYERGIDILRFDRGAPSASADEVAASWRSSRVSPVAEAERFSCRLAAAPLER